MAVSPFKSLMVCFFLRKFFGCFFGLKAEQSNGNLEELQQDRCKSARSEVRHFRDMKEFFPRNKKVILKKDVKFLFTSLKRWSFEEQNHLRIFLFDFLSSVMKKRFQET